MGDERERERDSLHFSCCFWTGLPALAVCPLFFYFTHTQKKKAAIDIITSSIRSSSDYSCHSLTLCPSRHRYSLLLSSTTTSHSPPSPNTPTHSHSLLSGPPTIAIVHIVPVHFFRLFCILHSTHHQLNSASHTPLSLRALSIPSPVEKYTRYTFSLHLSFSHPTTAH